MSANQQLTSVKVDKGLFEAFRIETIRMKFSLQKLTERAMYLYINDPEFRQLMHDTKIEYPNQGE